MVDAAIEGLRKAREALVDALQQEYFCDDVEPPPAAFGWDEAALVEFYKSGGTTLPATAMPAAAAAPAAPAAPAEPAGPDPALLSWLDETPGLEEIQKKLTTLQWDECEELLKLGRPKFLSRLKKEGLTLSEQQKFATAFGKATKPDVKLGIAGGGRVQPPPYELPKLDVPGSTDPALGNDVKKYQEALLRDGMPVRKAGIFPPNDDLLDLLANLGWKPFTKSLLHPTVDGGMAFGIVENGWCSGENAYEHGMDLRWHIKPGFDDQTLTAAVRFSEYAQVGRGHDTSIHGGAVESCLDESTAELCKSKLFPGASTAEITFKIKKPLMPNVTYRVFCKVESERVKGVAYDIFGEITDATNDKVVYASCVAKMANVLALAKEAQNAGVNIE